MKMECYKCGKKFTIKAKQFNPDKEFDPTDWECPACIKVENDHEHEMQAKLEQQMMEEQDVR